jgi:hypothetical protein
VNGVIPKIIVPFPPSKDFLDYLPLAAFHTRGHARADLVKSPHRQTAGICSGLQHQWRQCADEHGLGDALCAVTPDVPSDFTAARRMAGMSTAIMRDAAISAINQEKILIFPSIRAERPSVAEHYWLPFAPVLVINLCAVFRRETSHAPL